MTLTIELSEADEALLQKAAEQSKKTKEKFALEAVLGKAEDITRPDAEARKQMEEFLAGLRQRTREILRPLPESAFHRESYYED